MSNVLQSLDIYDYLELLRFTMRTKTKINIINVMVNGRNYFYIVVLTMA
jgi:hypothetical protein